jgi:putative endopeptidase
MAVRCVLAFILGAIAVVARADSICCAAETTSPLSGDFAPLGLDVRTLSKTLKPGDDFFGYINEGWIAATPIPPGYWDYGQTSVLIAKVERQVNQLIEETLATRARRGDVRQVIGDAFASFLDVAAIEKWGFTRVRSELGRIVAIRTPEAIARWMANPSSSSIIAINVYPAERRWRVHLDQLNLNQPMLGLPHDAYLGSGTDASAARESYRGYVAELLGRAGVDEPQGRAARVLALEARIAGNLWPMEKLRDRRANYHPMTVQELVEYAPGFPWRAFLDARGVSKVTDIVLGTDTAVQRQAALFASTPVDDWASYLAFHWLRNQIDVLPEELQRIHREFTNTQASRREVAMRLVNNALGLGVGQLYAKRFVTRQTKSSAEEMLTYLRRAFVERLNHAIWMDDGTRSEALAKLARMRFKVGYPEAPRDYSRLRIRRDDAAGNLQRLREADWAYQRARLRPDMNVELWNQTPQTVDASYSVLLNAIELPGAFLQSPYFDTNADPAVNFGAIGAILGHEMGHAFDDQGIIYDSEGRMRNWWSEASLAEFHRRTRALVEQYDAFAPFPDAHVSGQRTIGENIADLSGVLLAFRAYQLYLADHPSKGHASLDGLTGDQRFFAAWAQAWRYKAPESAIRHVLRYSYYAPTPYRVNGVMRNIDEWYAAFNVSAADKLYLPAEQRVRLW